MDLDADTRDRLTSTLLDWYSSHRRDLPWRHTRDPYCIWVAEMMLQQTQVQTVIPYYTRFLSIFPTVRHLAGASLQDVLKAWENLGYYARARHLHESARLIVDRWKGEIPSNWRDLTDLPGVGQYTAGALMSIAFGQRVPAVDGNSRRVLSRLFAVQQPVDLTETRKKLWGLMERLMPSANPGDFNQAMMDIGASICRPRDPHCGPCPLGVFCEAFRLGLHEELPVKAKRGPAPHRNATAGVIRDSSGRILIARRSNRGLLGGLWKLPGGKQAPGKSLQESLRDRIKEEIGISIRVRKKALATVHHTYTHFRLTVHVFHCVRLNGQPQALGCADWHWALPERFAKFPFSKVDHMVTRILMDEPPEIAANKKFCP